MEHPETRYAKTADGVHIASRWTGAGPMTSCMSLVGTRPGIRLTVDIADRAAGHLAHRDFVGHTVETILGPEDVTMNEVTLALGAALGIPDLRYVEFPPDGVQAALLGGGMSEEFSSLPGGDAARRERGSDDGGGAANG